MYIISDQCQKRLKSGVSKQNQWDLFNTSAANAVTFRTDGITCNKTVYVK